MRACAACMCCMYVYVCVGISVSMYVCVYGSILQGDIHYQTVFHDNITALHLSVVTVLLVLQSQY